MTPPDLDAAVTQARSVLARTTSAYAEWLDPDDRQRLDPRVTVIYLDHPERAIREPRSPVALEVADPAPVPVRERIRCRVRLFGRAVPDHRTAHGIRIQPTTVHVESGGTTVTPDPLALWQASPDPLTLAEADLLGHVDSRHPECVATLARLIPERVRDGADRIGPVALDSRGIVLRVEYAAGHRDVRLDFARPLSHACEAADAMAALLRRADPPPPAVGETKRRGLLAALFAAGPAATRICVPRDGAG